MAERNPRTIEFIRHRLNHIQDNRVIPELTRAVDAISLAADILVAEGFANVPTWNDLIAGLSPPQQDDEDLGDITTSRGWQRITTEIREAYARNHLERQNEDSDNARLRSCSGQNGSK